jgi:hypothetical protein
VLDEVDEDYERRLTAGIVSRRPAITVEATSWSPNDLHAIIDIGSTRCACCSSGHAFQRRCSTKRWMVGAGSRPSPPMAGHSDGNGGRRFVAFAALTAAMQVFSLRCRAATGGGARSR